eukprot:359821-Chlamydomonas_euryale.AAC.11
MAGQFPRQAHLTDWTNTVVDAHARRLEAGACIASPLRHAHAAEILVQLLADDLVRQLWAPAIRLPPQQNQALEQTGCKALMLHWERHKRNKGVQRVAQRAAVTERNNRPPFPRPKQRRFSALNADDSHIKAGRTCCVRGAAELRCHAEAAARGCDLQGCRRVAYIHQNSVPTQASEEIFRVLAGVADGRCWRLLALDPDLTTHQLRQPAADGQTHPGATIPPRHGFRHLLEMLKKPTAISPVRIDANASVRDSDVQHLRSLTTRHTCTDRELAARRVANVVA